MASLPDLDASKITPQHLRISGNATPLSTSSTNNLAAGVEPSTQQLNDYHDGRIRNPIPSKLKGKTDAKKGNFSVMLIDLGTRNESTERDAAAKRTSESTALRAKLAFQDGYVPLSQRKVRLDRSTPSAPPPAPPSEPPEPRREPLTPSETKAEQARLLTLLRSLHPVMVVDQVCKALAFFGGIPGAPSPPKDAGFPESHVANGSGSLFVGWLAEIFPPLGSMPPVSQKCPRGRPKGSKTTKLRRDRGLKKASKAAVPSQSEQRQSPSASNAEDGWVDVDESAPTNDDFARSDDHVLSATARPVVASGLGAPSTALANLPTPTRRRGRPKGSKNRPKEVHTPAGLSLASQENAGILTSASSGPQEVEAQPSIRTRRAGPGRPKGSKNKPKQSDGNTEGSVTKMRSGSDNPERPVDCAQPRASNAPVAQPALLGLDEQHLHPKESAPISDRSTVTHDLQLSESASQEKVIQAAPTAAKRKRPGPPLHQGRSADLWGDQNTTEPSFQSDGAPIRPMPFHAQDVDVVPHGTNGPIRKKHKASDISRTHIELKANNLPAKRGKSVGYHNTTGSSRGVPEFDKPNQHPLHIHDPNRDLNDANLLSTRHNQTETYVNQTRSSTKAPVHTSQQQHISVQAPNADNPQMARQNQPSRHHTGRAVSASQQPPTASAQSPDYVQQRSMIQQQQQSQHRQQYTQTSTSPVQLSAAASLEKAQLPTTNTAQDDSVHRGMASTAQKSPFSRAVATAPPSDAAGYRHNNSRPSVQQKHSTFQGHQAQQHSPHAHGPGMAAFHGYTDSSFLDLGNIDTSGTQTAIGVNTTSYSVSDNDMPQRNAGALAVSFAQIPAGGGQHEFEDAELREGTLRERMYHSLSRRPAE